MKKILSMLLCAAMLLGSFAVTSFAANESSVDKAILFDDLRLGLEKTGTSGYMLANNEQYVKEDRGFSMAFDFMALDATTCEHSLGEKEITHLSQFSLSVGGYNNGGFLTFGYNFDRKALVIGHFRSWFPNGAIQIEGHPKQNYEILAEYPVDLFDGWHRVGFFIEDIYLEIWLDGVKVIEFADKSLSHDHALFYSQHCRFLMDNVVYADVVYDLGNELTTKEELDAAIEEGIVHTYSDFNVETLKDPEYEKLVEEVMKQNEGKEEGDEGWVALDPEVDKPADEYVLAGCYYGTNEYGIVETSAYNLVDKSVGGHLVPDVADAALSFSDAESRTGRTFTSELTAKGGQDIDATLQLMTDEFVKFNAVENVASGCEVSVNGDKVTIKVPASVTGKVADFKFDVVTYGDYSAGQKSSYRYGLYSADGSVAVDGGKVLNINFTRGDANDDGIISLKDVACILKYRMGWYDDMDPMPINLDAANVVYDDIINSKDSGYILKHLAGWPENPLP